MQSSPGFVNGETLPYLSHRFTEIRNPATGEVTAQVCFATETECHHAVEVAQQAFSLWQSQPVMKRVQVLYQFRALLIQQIDHVSHLITRDHGKVLEDARGEVKRAIELIEHCCSAPLLLQGQYSQQVATGVDCHTIRQALGVCVGITPFNFPVMISTWLAIPAIVAGNCMVLKPSEKNPFSVMYLAELLQQAGLPNGVFNVVNGDKETVDQLITHPDVTAVTAVASTAVARSIYQTAIAHGKRAATFGGAKNHAIVMPDADWSEVIPAIMGAGFGAAGERCMAISAVVAVTDSVADALVARLSAAMPALSIGNGINEHVEMGPLISDDHRQRVASYLQLGIEEGAELVVDGRARLIDLPSQGYFLGASLFDRVQPSMRIYQEEIFGPIVVVLRCPDFESALATVNAHQYGNGAAIFTQSGAVAQEFSLRVQAGMVGINVPIPVPVASHAFGGWKQSCFGDSAMHGMEGVRFYTKSKSITTRWSKNASLSGGFQMPTHN